MEVGVGPEAPVGGGDCPGMKLFFFFSGGKKPIPGETFVSEPPFASAAAKTPATAEPDVSGLPFRATWFLYAELSRSLKVFGAGLTRLALKPIETAPQ